nr:ribonuclease H-like domain-containing protein [Tanacetum cinerariifolium]
MSDHEVETINEENTPLKVVPQITTVTNNSTKFHYLKKNDAKSITTDNDGNLKIRPPVTAEEHQHVQREEKARTILLSALPDEHMGDFYQMIDARDIWDAIKERFGRNVESKKMQKSLLKQKFEEFKVFEEEGLDKGYDKMQKILTQMNTLKITPDPEDVNMKFLRGLPPSWSGIALILKTKGGLEYISFNDLYNKLKFLEIDTKGYLSSSSTLFKAVFVSTGGSSQGNLSYQESGNGGYTTTHSVSPSSSSSKGSSKSKCSVVDDVIYSFFANHEIDQHLVYEDLDQMNKEDFEEYDLKNQMAMLSIKIASDADSEGEVVSTDDTIPAVVSIFTGDVAVAVISLHSETEFALMGLSTEAKWNNSGRNLYKLIDSSMLVRTKRGLGLDKYNGEGELGIDDFKFSIFHTNSDEFEGNLFTIDESLMVYGKKATDSSKIKTNDDSISHSYDSVLFDFSDSVSAPASESKDTIVIDCARQEDFPSVCTSSIQNDVISSKTLCNKFGSFNKESHFRKHKCVTSKSCYICGGYLHLIKDCDLHEQRLVKTNAKGKGKLGRRPTGKTANLNRPNPVSAGKATLACNSIPLSVSTANHLPHTHNLLYSLYMTSGLNEKTVVKPSAGWPWTKYGMSKTKGSKINGGSKFKSWSYAKGPLGRPKSEMTWVPKEN